jgi:type II secretory pathway pseudopilin PulG
MTLVELLVVVVVIAILAAMVLGALQVARDSAREAKTRATIAKLHNVLMGMYESYHTRRVPIDPRLLAGTSPYSANDAIVIRDPHIAALVRLYLLRDIMRMEMPDRVTDITSNGAGNAGPNSFSIQWTTPSNTTLSLSRNVSLPVDSNGNPIPPALFQAYSNRLASVNLSPTSINMQHLPAELLYLIVTVGCHQRGQFAENEIGVDPPDPNDPQKQSAKIPYFVDGWGNPIYMLRWAPGLAESDIQPVVVQPSGGGSYAVSSSLETAAIQTNHDPFDPLQVDSSAWRLVPLVYSLGRDGQSGISIDGGTSPYVWKNDTYTGIPVQGGAVLVGTPDGTNCRTDNVHNHRLAGDRK